MNRHHPHARMLRGFTLIEVLAALMLMVIVLPVVMGGLSTATRAGSLTKSRDLAVTLGESKLTEIVAARDWQNRPQNRRVSFDASFGLEGERYTWTLEVNNWRDAELRELTLAVHWHQHGREHVQRLTTLVAAEGVLP